MSRIPRGWNFNIDFIGRMHAILWATAALTVASLVSLAVFGLNFGTDFAGGYELQVHFPRAVSESEIRAVIEPMALADARVQRFGPESDNAYLILVRDAGDAKLQPQPDDIRATLGRLVGGEAHVTRVAVDENGEALAASLDAPVTETAVLEALKAQGLRVKAVHVQLPGHDGEAAASAAHDAASEAPAPSEQEVAVHVTLVGLADTIAQALVAGLHLEPSYEPLSRVEFVGPQVGAQLRNQGLMAVVYALALILVYVAVRFDMYFAPGAIIATLHDVILTMGFFSVFQIDFNLTVVAAILTLIGFSLNDTIVVYDRIRENAAKRLGIPLDELVNRSINETLSRTILTSGTVLMVTAALLILGGPFIRGFAVTMFVGVVVGTCSSIAVASPLYMAFRAWGERGKPGRSRAAAA